MVPPINGKKRFLRLLDISQAGEQSIFLFGPRGSGKTSWITDHLPKAIVIDLLESTTYQQLLAVPSRLEKLIPPHHTDWIVIDEIQKVPQLLNEVHRLIEANKWRFLLTGSSARSLRRRGVNLLAGRALDYRMHPLTCNELGKNFNLIKALQCGLLPTVYQVTNPYHYLSSYVGTYLREEIASEGVIRNIGDFSRFLEIASFSQGQLLNLSEIAREVAIERRILSGFFDIVEEMLIGVRLPVFSKRAKRKLVTHQKFYYFDTGVYRALRPKGPLDRLDEIDGPALETLFFHHLRAINDYFRLGYQFYFWRTADQQEVDFIAYGERGLLAFEIKRGREIQEKDLKGLKSFGEEYEMARLYLLYGGEKKEYHGRIELLPFEETLFDLKKLLEG